MNHHKDDGITIDPRIRGHLPVLDGIRGLAIVLVVFNHIGTVLQPPWDHAADELFFKLSGSAWLGVDLFFVLSGFLITGILVDSRGAPHFFRNFYVRRSLRIFPLYFAFLAIVFLLVPTLGGAVADAPERAAQGWYWAYASNVLFAIWDRIPMATGHLWSLAVEEQFYLVWPFVVVAVAPRRLLRACLALIALVFVGRLVLVAMGTSWVQMYVLTPTRLDSLATGATIALLVRRPGGMDRLAALAPKLAVAGGAMSLILMFYKPLLAIARGVPIGSVNSTTLPWDLYVQSTRFTFYALFFGALIVLALVSQPGGALARVFGSAPMRMFGRYSYAIYMIHVPLHALAERHGFAGEFLPRVAGWQIPRAIVMFLVLLAVSTLLAMVSWHLFEKHFLKIKERFAYRPRDEATRKEARATEQEAFASP